MHGKMKALEALLEMLSKMDLDRMAPKDGGLKSEDQAASLLAKETDSPEENPLHEALETPEMEAKEKASDEEEMDEEELKKFYSSI